MYFHHILTLVYESTLLDFKFYFYTFWFLNFISSIRSYILISVFDNIHMLPILLRYQLVFLRRVYYLSNVNLTRPDPRHAMESLDLSKTFADMISEVYEDNKFHLNLTCYPPALGLTMVH